MLQSPDLSAQIHEVDDNGLFMIWLYNLPTWLFALLTIAFFVSISLFGLLIIHRRVNQGMFTVLVDNGTVGWFFSGVTVLYGLLLGLLTVATWSNYTQATGLASQEAASLAVLYRDLTSYPLPDRPVLQTRLRNYTKFIIQKSWPLQRKGLIHDGESVELVRFQQPLMAFEPTTETGKIVHQEAIRAFNSLVELRRLRSESISRITLK